jgi:hypothetical protein
MRITAIPERETDHWNTDLTMVSGETRHRTSTHKEELTEFLLLSGVRPASEGNENMIERTDYGYYRSAKLPPLVVYDPQIIVSIHQPTFLLW